MGMARLIIGIVLFGILLFLGGIILFIVCGVSEVLFPGHPFGLLILFAIVWAAVLVERNEAGLSRALKTLIGVGEGLNKGLEDVAKRFREGRDGK